jgi:hypothetical protein
MYTLSVCMCISTLRPRIGRWVRRNAGLMNMHMSLHMSMHVSMHMNSPFNGRRCKGMHQMQVGQCWAEPPPLTPSLLIGTLPWQLQTPVRGSTC